VSRDKGNVAEREVAGALTEWWAPYEPSVRFVRTPLSGGWGAPAVRSEFRACGDIMTTSPTFPWCVEVKRREAWSWDTLLAGKASPVWGWWERAQVDATTAKLAAMMWFRHSREPWSIMLSAAPPGVHARFVTDLGRGVLVSPAAALLAVDPKYILSVSV
jgi:hypothetical protein